MFNLLPGILLLLSGGSMMLYYRQQRLALQSCTEAVTARIVDVGKIKQRSGYRYFYKLRYHWQGAKYTAEFSTILFQGEKDEETVLYIHPGKPEKFLRPDYDATGYLMMGIGLLGTGAVFLISGYFWK